MHGDKLIGVILTLATYAFLKAPRLWTLVTVSGLVGFGYWLA
jgi:hypothetical protein